MYKMIGTILFVGSMAVTFPRQFMAQQEQGAVINAAVERSNGAKAKKGPRTAVGWRDRSGHYSFNAQLNRSNVKVLVDTGASAVAINRSTARRIGLKLTQEDFVHPVSTANGQTFAAKGKIRDLRIGAVHVRNVAALVLEDKALSGTLLGMSFLNKLKKFEFDGNKLTLIQ